SAPEPSPEHPVAPIAPAAPAAEAPIGIAAATPSPAPTPPSGGAPKRQRLQTGEGKPAQPSQFESLDLDMDFLGDWGPSKAAMRRPVKRAAENLAPPAPNPAPAAIPIEPASKPKAAPPPVSRPDAAPAAALSEDRVRELHGRLLEAKRQTNEAGKVSLESLE